MIARPLVLTTILMLATLLVPPSANASGWWNPNYGAEAQTTTWSAAQIGLSGNAAFHASCPSPESDPRPCAKVGPNGRAFVTTNIGHRGPNTGAAGDYAEVSGVFGRATDTFDTFCTYVVSLGGATVNQGSNCRETTWQGLNQKDIYRSWSPGTATVEIQCVGYCRGFVIYELTFEVGFAFLLAGFEVEEESTLPGRICVKAIAPGYSPWYPHLKLLVDWGDGERSERPWMGAWGAWRGCHEYAIALAPYAITLRFTDDLGQEQRFDHVHGSPTYDHDETCRRIGPWGSIQYQTCMAANPEDPVCSPLYVVFSGIWWEGDCAWATGDPVSWGQAVVAEEMRDWL